MPQATKPAAETSGAPSQPVPADTAADLSTESIGWLFIQKYYASYTADKSKLYAFYDTEAALLHEAFPTSAKAATKTTAKMVHVAHGSAAVRAFYESSEDGAAAAEKNKIVVESAAFQASVDGAILIVVSGAWRRGASLLCHFSQTFVLRAKGKTVYDIANDVLTFVDVVAAHDSSPASVHVVEPTEPVVPVETPVNEPTPQPEIAPELVPEPLQEPKDSTPTTAADAPTSAAPAEKTAAAPAESAQSEPETQTPVEDAAEPAAPQPEPASEHTKPAAPAVPAQKPTWANLAAIGPKTTAKATTVATPIASKTVVSTAPPAATTVAAKKTASPSQAATQAAAQAAGKYKKEEWYPIYIKNVDVDEEELKSALVKQFGDIKFFKRTNKTALCDFRSKEDQQRALEQREMVIRNNVILLEPRIHKTFNGKPDAKKEKKHVKKPVPAAGNGNGNGNGFKKN